MYKSGLSFVRCVRRPLLSVVQRDASSCTDPKYRMLIVRIWVHQRLNILWNVADLPYPGGYTQLKSPPMNRVRSFTSQELLFVVLRRFFWWMPPGNFDEWCWCLIAGNSRKYAWFYFLFLFWFYLSCLARWFHVSCLHLLVFCWLLLLFRCDCWLLGWVDVCPVFLFVIKRSDRGLRDVVGFCDKSNVDFILMKGVQNLLFFIFNSIDVDCYYF